VAARPEDSNGATREVTIGATEERSRDRCLAVRCRGRPKKRTQGDGGYRQKLAAARRRLTRRASPARRKGRNHKGPTVENRQRKGPECNNGISNRGLKEQPRLGSKRAFNKTVRQTPGLKIAKRAVEFSVGLRKMSDWTLWRSRPPPKRKGDYPQLQCQGCTSVGHSRRFCPHRSEKRKWLYALGYFGRTA
jgi:hypothetical protein